MRRLALSSAACVALALFAVTALADEPKTAPSPTAASAREPLATASATERVAPIPDATTTIDPNVKEPVCRRYIPTGSRIAEQRCEMPKDTLSAQEQASRDILRRDVADLRMQQQLRDQARAAAMADALRRRGGQ